MQTLEQRHLLQIKKFLPSSGDDGSFISNVNYMQVFWVKPENSCGICTRTFTHAFTSRSWLRAAAADNNLHWDFAQNMVSSKCQAMTSVPFLYTHRHS